MTPGEMNDAFETEGLLSPIVAAHLKLNGGFPMMGREQLANLVLDLSKEARRMTKVAVDAEIRREVVIRLETK